MLARRQGRLACASSLSYPGYTTRSPDSGQLGMYGRSEGKKQTRLLPLVSGAGAKPRRVHRGGVRRA